MLTSRGIQLVAVVLSVGLISHVAADEHEREKTHDRPIGTAELSMEIPSNTIHLFQDAGFAGDHVAIDDVTKTIKRGSMLELPDGMNDSVSSLRWNLPPHVVVILHEDAGGKGEQAVLWGKGELRSLDWWDINDKISRWTWFNIGSALKNTRLTDATDDGDESEENADDEAGEEAADDDAPIAPKRFQPLSMELRPDTMQLYRDTEYDDDMVPVTSVTEHAEGELHPLSGRVEDSLSSLRWNLPRGVIVVFYQNAGGEKQHVAVWGKGEAPHLDVWDINDKVSRWAWFRIAPEQKEGEADKDRAEEHATEHDHEHADPDEDDADQPVMEVEEEMEEGTDEAGAEEVE